MKVDTPVELSTQNTAEGLTGQCLNLSGGGMLVAVDKELAIGEKLEVRISSPHGHHPILHAKTEVARVYNQPEKQRFSRLIGMKIVEMLPD